MNHIPTTRRLYSPGMSHLAVVDLCRRLILTCFIMVFEVHYQLLIALALSFFFVISHRE